MNFPFKISLQPVEDMAALGAEWRDLEARADGSWFQSWAWLGPWVSHSIRERLQPLALTVRAPDRLVGIALLIAARTRRHGFVGSNGLYLHETGDRRQDQLTIEHNGILAERTLASKVTAACIESLARRPERWDEFYFGGVGAKDRVWIEQAAATQKLRCVINVSTRCDYVDLDAVRAAGVTYVETLSSNTRYQVRRASRLYEASGPIAISIARDLDEAIRFFNALKELHQRYWRDKGQSGAFTNDFFERFHRDLIRDQFAAGTIQLIAVRAGPEVIGYLYNFLYRDHVYSYQSGLAYGDDPKLKPGLVAHCRAIERNLSEGRKIYDFLGGESQYKRSLGNHATELTWLVLQRNRLKFRVEDLLRLGKRHLEEYFDRRRE